MEKIGQQEHRYSVGDIVQMRKNHPCGGCEWEVVRVGADFRIKCLKCLHQVMLPRARFERGVRKLLTEPRIAND